LGVVFFAIDRLSWMVWSGWSACSAASGFVLEVDGAAWLPARVYAAVMLFGVLAILLILFL